MEVIGIMMLVVLELLLIVAYYGTILMFVALAYFSYIMQAVSFSTIARRRGIRNPWLAWIPYANTWQVGLIADEYTRLTTGEDSRLRDQMLRWKIIYTAAIPVFAVAFYICYIALMFGSLFLTEFIGMEPKLLAVMVCLIFLSVFLLFVAALTVLEVLFFIAQFKALNRIYRSCDPNNSTLFLVLSILATPILSLCVFFDRHKDLGMPSQPEELPAQ